MKATQIRRFSAELTKRVRGVHVSEDPPARSGGIWYLDASYRNRSAVVEWHPRKGFGLSRSKEAIYGEGPHEVFTDPLATARRTAELLLENGYTAPPSEAPIARIRLLRGLSQEDLARRLHVRQAAVSKLERKSNVQIGTLRRVIRALGARLVMRVEWGGRSLELNQFDLPDKEPRRKGR